MAMTATLTVPGNIIAGARTTVMLNVANSGATDVTLTNAIPVLTPSGAVVGGSQPTMSYAPPQYPPNRTATVSASGSLNVPVDMVFNFPQTPGNGNVMPGSAYLLDFIVTVSDGTVCSVTNPQWVSVAPGTPGPSQGFGQLAFNDGRNLINVALW